MRVRLIAGQDLARCIPQRLVVGPDQFIAPDAQARVGFVRHQAVIQRFTLDFGFGQRRFQALAAGAQVIGVRLGHEEVANRPAQGAVPVLIEAVPELLGNRPHP
ncbi:hypothetical protein D3C81_1382720 [compost metagenome]